MLETIFLEKDCSSVFRFVAIFFLTLSQKNRWDGMLKDLAHQRHSWGVQVLQLLVKGELLVTGAGNVAA